VSGKHSFYSLQPRTRLKIEELSLERFCLKAQKTMPEKLKAITVKEVMTLKPVVLNRGSTIKKHLTLLKEQNSVFAQ
jgi:hypothetical protein